MEKFLAGIRQGLGFVTVVVLAWFAYALASYSALPNVDSWDPLSKDAWNALVGYANKAVKQDTEVLTVTGGNLQVSGRVKISGGSPSVGKTLVSDASGLWNWGYQKTPFSSATAVATSIPANVWTVVKMADSHDPYDFFNPATNRFQPTVAGYYQVSGLANYNGSANAGWAHTLYFYLRKNGAAAYGSSFLHDGSYAGSYVTTLAVNGILYMNGTTDYADFQFIDNAYAGSVSATANMVLVSE